MKTLPLSQVKAQFSKLVDEVSSRDEKVTITRNGRPAAMLVGPDEIESWEATVELLSDPKAMEEIRRGLRNLERGRLLSEVQIEELFDLEPGVAAPVVPPGTRSQIRRPQRRRKSRL